MTEKTVIVNDEMLSLFSAVPSALPIWIHGMISQTERKVRKVEIMKRFSLGERKWDIASRFLRSQGLMKISFNGNFRDGKVIKFFDFDGRGNV